MGEIEQSSSGREMTWKVYEGIIEGKYAEQALQSDVLGLHTSATLILVGVSGPEVADVRSHDRVLITIKICFQATG